MPSAFIRFYVSAPANERLSKPAKELKAFAKTKELKSGETQTITMTVTVSDLASFDEKASVWVTDSGTYQFLIGASSQDIKASLDIFISQKTEIKTNNVLKLQEKINILTK
jgi:beta-glucosidase